ncbi:hypothetical protein HispidOSU_020551, partial [Sigmodon hispidus]
LSTALLSNTNQQNSGQSYQDRTAWLGFPPHKPGESSCLFEAVLINDLIFPVLYICALNIDG